MPPVALRGLPDIPVHSRRDVSFLASTAPAPVSALGIAGLSPATKPNAVFAFSSMVAALQRESRTIAIVFTAIFGQMGGGFVERLARPDGVCAVQAPA